MKFVSMLLTSLTVFGQVRWKGETEFTQDQKGNQTYDLYGFGSTKQLAFFGRYFKAEPAINRGEFGLGHTFLFCKDKDKRPRLIITPYLGATTDKAALLAVVNVVSIAGRTFVYIPDMKVYSGRKTLYQEVSASLTKRGKWQFRSEHLRLFRTTTTFNRLGIERRFSVGSGRHFHVSPFYDTTNKQAGFYAGFRW